MPLKIYHPVRTNWGATEFYRFLQPMTFMQKAGLIEPYVDFGDNTISEEVRSNAMAYTDIHWRYQDMAPTFQRFLEATLKAGPYWRTRDTWEPPVNMVIDADDDVFNISPNNAAPFRRMGTTYKGIKLERGAKITGESRDGEIITLYEDGKDGFNVARNQLQAEQYRHNLSIASLVTVSTEGMQQAILKEVPGANTYVNPNCIDMEDYPKIELADHSPTVRVLWQGGDSHLEDMHHIRDSLTKILKKYPFVELVIWGAKYVWPEWPAAQVRHEPWRPYQEYKLRLNQMNHDIALAPLVPGAFNDAKSAIKVYESAACWKPAPTVAANVGPYREFEDGITAALYNTLEEFEEKLSELIENQIRRRLIADNCKDWVVTNRDPMTWAHKLAQQFEELRLARKAFTKAPPEPTLEPTEDPNAEHPVSANLD